MLYQHPKADHFVRELQQKLTTALQGGDASASTLARQMNSSLRSFYQQLARHGLRYRAVLADTRFKLARMYLADQRLSVADVALLLGYSEQSAFTRAFRGWSGETPAAYRCGRAGKQMKS